MKITEKRMKQIILEEIRVLENEEQPQEEETKTLAAFKKFLYGKTKEVSTMKGASTTEVKEMAEIIQLMMALIDKGEVTRIIKYAKEQLKIKAGIK